LKKSSLEDSIVCFQLICLSIWMRNFPLKVF